MDLIYRPDGRVWGEKKIMLLKINTKIMLISFFNEEEINFMQKIDKWPFRIFSFLAKSDVSAAFFSVFQHFNFFSLLSFTEKY